LRGEDGGSLTGSREPVKKASSRRVYAFEMVGESIVSNTAMDKPRRPPAQAAAKRSRAPTRLSGKAPLTKPRPFREAEIFSGERAGRTRSGEIFTLTLVYAIWYDNSN